MTTTTLRFGAACLAVLLGFVAADAKPLKGQPAPQPGAAPGGEPMPETPDLQKQIDDALKQLDALDKIVPNQPDEAKKQIDDIRQKLRQDLLKGINGPGAVIGGGGFGNGIILQPGLGGFAGRNVNSGAARLGVLTTRPTAVLVEQLQLPEGQGQVVMAVVPESAAAKAGIQKHDILLEIDGKAVSSDLTSFQRGVREIKADTEVTAQVVRKGAKETIKGLKLPEAKAEAAIQPFPGFPGGVVPNVPQIQIIPGGGIPPGIQPGGFGGAAGGAGAFPGIPGGVIKLQVIGNAGNGESTSVSISNDDFTIRHTTGGTKIAIKGKRENGKATPSEIVIDDGDATARAATLEEVPERHRATVQRLLDGVR